MFNHWIGIYLQESSTNIQDARYLLIVFNGLVDGDYGQDFDY